METIFLKLGGSLITDKTGVEQTRPAVLRRLAGEIQRARLAKPGMRLVLGHGSGSFGHVAGAKYGTRAGVKTGEQWFGFAEVGASAARLNRIVVETLLSAGLPAIGLAASSSAICEDGQITAMALEPVERALDKGLLPALYGDVAFDRLRGGTIISTEEILSYLAHHMPPEWLLLAGETAGVLDENGAVIPAITPANLPDVQAVLGGSRGADVTGGMASKVAGMLALTQSLPGLKTRIFSGLVEGMVEQLLVDPAAAVGTLVG